MPKTIFQDGTPVDPEFLNALNNPVYKVNPENDGEIPFPPAPLNRDFSVVDCDLMVESGTYGLTSDSALHIPDPYGTSFFGVIIVSTPSTPAGGGEHYIMQQCVPTAFNALWVRNYNGFVWTPWERVYPDASIGEDAVDTQQIADGAVTLDKLANPMMLGYSDTKDIGGSTTIFPHAGRLYEVTGPDYGSDIVIAGASLGSMTFFLFAKSYECRIQFNNLLGNGKTITLQEGQLAVMMRMGIGFMLIRVEDQT